MWVIERKRLEVTVSTASSRALARVGESSPAVGGASARRVTRLSQLGDNKEPRPRETTGALVFGERPPKRRLQYKVELAWHDGRPLSSTLLSPNGCETGRPIPAFLSPGSMRRAVVYLHVVRARPVLLQPSVLSSSPSAKVPRLQPKTSAKSRRAPRSCGPAMGLSSSSGEK